MIPLRIHVENCEYIQLTFLDVRFTRLYLVFTQFSLRKSKQQLKI